MLAVCGLVVGFGVNGTELAMRLAADLGMQWTRAMTTPTYDIGRVATALGYLALVMLACRRGRVPRLRRALAPVGRMALTNYLMQSAICLIVFHGLGFGLWSRLDRAELYLVVAAIRAFQIAFSRWWLRRHRFGPMEWLWRALTYAHPPGAHRRALERPGEARQRRQAERPGVTREIPLTHRLRRQDRR